MARRGRKSYTLDEKLQIVTENITKTEECLCKLKEEKKQLEIQIKEQRLLELDKMISESGKSFEEVKGLLFVQ